MIRSLALLTLFATPFLANAQAPGDEAVAAAKAPVQPLVTFDVTGAFPANAPTTRMTAPNAAFLLEVTFDQTVPAQLESFSLYTNLVSANYCYEGHAYTAVSGSYFVFGSIDNGYNLTLRFPGNFTLTFASLNTSPGHPAPYPITFPYTARRTPETSDNPNPNPQGYVTFTPGDAGAPANPWHLAFTNPHGQSVATLVKVTDLVGRLVLPNPQPLGTR